MIYIEDDIMEQAMKQPYSPADHERDLVLVRNIRICSPVEWKPQQGWYNHAHPGIQDEARLSQDCSEVFNLGRRFQLKSCKITQIMQNQCVTHAILGKVFSQKA